MSELLRAVKWDKMAGNQPCYEQDLNHPYVQLSMDLVKEEYGGVGELLESFEAGNVQGVIDGATDLLKVTTQLLFSISVDPEAALKQVNDSNFSKFCTNEEDAVASVKSYENDDRYVDVFYEKVEDMYIIKGWKTGQDKSVHSPKVLKGIHYFEPYLHHFIRDSGCYGSI